MRVQQERQAKTDDMMRKLMEKVVHLQTPNLTSQSPHVNRPRMTELLAPSSVRHGPSDFRPPSLVPEGGGEPTPGHPALRLMTEEDLPPPLFLDSEETGPHKLSSFN